jgi:hypothetical protein
MNTNAAQRVPDVDVCPQGRYANPRVYGGSESAVNGVCSLVRRVAGTSLEEIDNMIVELQKLRVFLVGEGERLQRELADYGKLTKAALRSSKIITESLPNCKTIADSTGRD